MNLADAPPKINRGATSSRDGRPVSGTSERKHSLPVAKSASPTTPSENPPIRETDLLTWLAAQAICLFKSESDYMSAEEVARRAFDVGEAMLRERGARIKRRSMI